MSRWKYIRCGGDIYRDIGVNEDGSVHNPHGYPEDVVRAAVTEAEARRHARASAAAKKAAQTRRRRRERLVYKAVQRLMDGGALTPGTNCEICGRGLDDPESKARGVGSDCWQLILAAIEAGGEIR
jgi:Family of unknown function (DUF6011)